MRATAFSALAGACKACGVFFDVARAYEPSQRYATWGNALNKYGFCRQCAEDQKSKTFTTEVTEETKNERHEVRV